MTSCNYSRAKATASHQGIAAGRSCEVVPWLSATSCDIARDFNHALMHHDSSRFHALVFVGPKVVHTFNFAKRRNTPRKLKDNSLNLKKDQAQRGVLDTSWMRQSYLKGASYLPKMPSNATTSSSKSSKPTWSQIWKIRHSSVYLSYSLLQISFRSFLHVFIVFLRWSALLNHATPEIPAQVLNILVYSPHCEPTRLSFAQS